MDLISQFVARYRKEYDFYEQACRMTAQVLDSNLQSAGVRAIVTSRAKSPTRLETKVRQRAVKTPYATVEGIYDDIVDLAGVRVALYFPAEREEVGRVIKSLFVPVAEPKEFPTAAQPTYKKRFSGYWATHYRVRLPETLLNESQKRYTEAKVEIQVASVLMHAWSEVEHDLVYKPMQGKLSPDEYAILDELNGLVLAGEIALERLQRAGELRVSAHDREYTNHYDLASSLLEMAREKLAGLNIHDSALGRVDLLFELLQQLELNTPDHLTRYVTALHSDFERRPLAEQVIDQVLSEDSTRYAIFEQIRMLDVPAFSLTTSDVGRVSQSDAIGQFMSLWIDYEKMIRSYAASKGAGGQGVPSMRILRLVEDVPPDVHEAAERLRRFRNQLVHGIEVPDADYIRVQATELRHLVERVQQIIGPKPKPKPKRKPARKASP
ncbi:MAG: RelA/SpoT domain-containing protein [Candidatus Accumulibacter cognatus]|uniref:RelA/SpoT domain-containing protein n=1 Tax=Candidatus Accumulibacter cognatus TaxID=2954383 RepID=A0A7D5NAG6_9PROT|nr:MAG: RelA/SpoT domain-containing protein [Candidatus Accumulibacter cognatus]